MDEASGGLLDHIEICSFYRTSVVAREQADVVSTNGLEFMLQQRDGDRATVDQTIHLFNIKVGTRLDRFYSSHDLSPYIRTARVLQTSSSGIKFDHRPIILDLQGRNIRPPVTLERPKVKLPRVKCSFRLSTKHLSEAIKELQE